MIKQIKKSGFTIVELIIVITVISILAALVINSFSGTQARGRDTERQIDIDTLSAHLESFYKDKGYYPTFEDVSSNTWLTANLKGFDLGAVRVPRYTGSTNSLVDFSSVAVTTSNYGYKVSGGRETTCSGAGANCGVHFTLVWKSEDTGQYVYTQSKN